MRRFAPEAVVGVLLVLAFVLSAVLVPDFRDPAYLFDRSTLLTETGLLALALTPLIVAGHIDLSCTTVLALVGVLASWLAARLGVPFWLCLALCPPLGAALGAINGWLVGRRRLPSLVVTIGTMALFRGVAQILAGDKSLPVPQSYQGVHLVTLPKTYFHLPMLVYLALAIAIGTLLHRTVFGRHVYAVGTNSEAARYAGVSVGGTIFWLFLLSGGVAGLGAALLLSRLGVARYDNARGWELDAITAVVLGGTSIFGGRGTVVGTVLALALVGIVQTGLGVAGVKAEIQGASTGALLILAILLGNLLGRKRGA
jgi:rhamnose transport system permease protein